MKLAAVFPGQIPSATSNNGVPVMSWALVKALCERGHEVSICTTKPSRFAANSWDENIAALERNGIRVHQLSPSGRQKAPLRWAALAQALRVAAVPRDRDFYPSVEYSDDFAKLVRQERPDVVYLFTMEAVAIADGASGVPPRLAVLVDLDHLVRKYRRAYRPVQKVSERVFRGLEFLRDLRLRRTMVRMLRACDGAIDHAANHADWLRGNGVENVHYLPNPVLDASDSARPPGSAAGEKPTFLLLGNLDGIATVAGLHLVATEVLPALEKLMGPGGFVLKVAGAGTLPKSLTGRFERPSVRLQGFVPTVAGALAESHVLLVPTPIRLGFRTRIAEAFSCSAAVVAHEANKAGMPELVHGQNVLLGGTGNELAEHLVRLARDGTERARLGAKARRTYEEKLEARKVCGKMIGILESVAKEGKTR